MSGLKATTGVDGKLFSKALAIRFILEALVTSPRGEYNDQAVERVAIDWIQDHIERAVWNLYVTYTSNMKSHSLLQRILQPLPKTR